MGKKSSFFGKFGVLCFLVTPILRFDTVSPYYRRMPIFKNTVKFSSNLTFDSRGSNDGASHLLEKVATNTVFC